MNAMMKTVIISFALSSVVMSGCAVLVGNEDTEAQTSQAPLKIISIETLRNQQSLRGEGFKDVAFNTNSADTLQLPVSVFADAFKVYVVDKAPTSRIFIFNRGERTVTILDRTKIKAANSGVLVDPSGVPVPDSGENPVAFDGSSIVPIVPSGIAVDMSGDIFVADSQQGRVFGYDSNGRLLMTFGRTGGILHPSGLAIDNRRGRLYIADEHAHQVKVFSTTGDPMGNSLFTVSGSNKASEGFKFPSSVALDRAGNLYVLDSTRRRVYVYDPDAKFIRVFAVHHDTWGGALRPKGIAVDSMGHVYITDMVSNSVFIFNPDGALLLNWGRTGVVGGDFMMPAGIFIDSQDSIYIADQTNGRVQHFNFSMNRPEK